jgi:glucose-fructose oxidoreductase
VRVAGATLPPYGSHAGILDASKIRYAVIGLGHISQTAVLPAFKHAENSELAALVTGHPEKDLGGGTLFDIGIYCINAARYLFRDEPIEVIGLTANNGENRFAEIEEMTGAIMRFPHERLAIFMCSFGSTDVSEYDLVGTKGHLRLENAYEYQGELKCVTTIHGKRSEKIFKPGDQFALELIYFSDCIIHDRAPEPSGTEGLADVRVINAIYESAEIGRAVRIEPVPKKLRPDETMQIKRPPLKKPGLVGASAPR